MIEVTFKAGARRIECEFQAFRTTAPKDYDSGSTIELYEGGGERVVLIRSGEVEWHRGRYASGLYGLTPEEDLDSEFAIRLFERMYGRVS